MQHTIKVTYKVKAKNIKQAAKEIAYGQSIGNPYIRTHLDEAITKKHLPACTIQDNKITVAYPLANFDVHDGFINVNHMMSMFMGGQMDIDNIRACELVNIDFGNYTRMFPRPQYGIKGIRARLGIYGRPLIGAIVKPKIGISPKEHADVVEAMVDGGADFIKEDEILADQKFCPLETRLTAVYERIKDRPVVYAACITADGIDISRRAWLVNYMFSGTQCAPTQCISGVHLNIWAGLGAYAALRKQHMKPDPFTPAIHFQKSGDKVWTTGENCVKFTTLCQLVNLIGCDFMHVGMYGGYMADSEYELRQRIAALKNTIPSFSCGATPAIAAKIKKTFGNDVMIAAGGYVCGHPKGVGYAVREFRESVA